jgi:hypothetical protein
MFAIELVICKRTAGRRRPVEFVERRVILQIVAFISMMERRKVTVILRW